MSKMENEKKILELIISDYTWEQALYKIVAWEGLDPWDLDIKALSEAFVSKIVKLEQLDFKIPAKYVIISAVLLRMKSDHLDFLEEMLSIPEENIGVVEEESGELAEIESEAGILNSDGFDINAVTVPNKRQPHRKVVLSELVLALRNVMKAQDRRDKKSIRRRGQIRLREHKITQRLDSLYKKIDDVLKKLKDEKMPFSSIVTKWNREEVVNNFLPLIYLDHQKKIECTQKEPFEEIFIRKR